MSTSLTRERVDTESGDDLVHAFCWCTMGSVAYCGAPIADRPIDIARGPNGSDCAVCLEIEQVPCERCGR